jgi:beta-glucosidase
LVGFERIHLLPGEEKEVAFVIQPRDLQLYNIDEEWVVEPGDFRVMVGASSEDIRLQDVFTVVENADIKGKSIQKSEELRVVSTPFSSTAKNVLDNDFSTYFEIQLSSGGGQFLTVYKGKPSRINVPEKYVFKESMATDLRIIVDSGFLKIAEVYINR